MKYLIMMVMFFPAVGFAQFGAAPETHVSNEMSFVAKLLANAEIQQTVDSFGYPNRSAITRIIEDGQLIKVYVSDPFGRENCFTINAVPVSRPTVVNGCSDL